MIKKSLIIISFFFIYIGTSFNTNAEVNVPLNVDLTQKITTDTATFHEFNQAVVQGQTIYVPERQGNKITAINAIDRSIKWEYSTNANTAYYGFRGVRDLLFFQANGTLTALKDNGSEATIVWTKPYHATEFTLQGTTLYLFKEGKLAALDVNTGVEKWEYTLPTRERAHSNIVPADGKIFFVTDNQMDMERKMYALNSTTSQPLWTTTNVDYYAQKLSFSGGKIYVKGYKDMNAFDANNGTFIWKFPVQENFDFEINATTIFTKTYDGVLVAIDSNNNLYYHTVAVDTVMPTLHLEPLAKRFSPHEVSNTKITFYLSEDANVILTVKNSQGQAVKTVDFGLLNKGWNDKFWDGKDESGTVVPYGQYTLSFKVKDLAGNEAIIENLERILGVADLFATTVEVTVARKGADVSYEELVTIPTGVRLTITDEINDWYQVNFYVNSNGYSGFVPKALVATRSNPNPIETASTEDNTVIYSVQSGDTLWKIAQKFAVSTQALVEANQLDPTKYLYVGQQLTIPTVTTEPNQETVTVPEQSLESVTHTVQSGDTLWKIAQQYGVTVQAIVDLNMLDLTKHLYVGKTLIVSTTPQEQLTMVTYSVQSGDTLWLIAQKHSVTTQQLVEANKLDPAKYLYIGQKLVIPTQEQPTTVMYTVQLGDTLWLIAQKQGVTTNSIIETNKLDPTKYLYVGQKLQIAK